MNVATPLAEALLNPVLGARLPGIELSGIFSPQQAVEGAIACWAPGAELRSLYLSTGTMALLDTPVMDGSIYALSRGGDTEIILRIQSVGPSSETMTATAALQLRKDR